ncbi:hypothetical protein PPL_02874 [Heterostelium album PN500]|uniref:Uncharacterized protein n=1 Tax=Heterostelium pallidum (strain ATCC 26659 / Pp 5 / PN500) TaxID=670386 RepID=D3B3A8_HETP5|nr:hypothetical protein PPL_02874 [Heterostelium album PN500]EFA83806.1 hypothetical protein PPL_02874 [Heterostelium album PN500]|eukprot:XP_020435923.1 hypothetical protein PPL_02874 [Heterostelium album PN500]
MKINSLLFFFSLSFLILFVSLLEINYLISSQPSPSLSTKSSSTSGTTKLQSTTIISTSSFLEYQQQFTDWMIQNNKSYTNNEFLTRFHIFIDNLLYVNQFNSLTGNDTDAMRLGMNVFADLTLDEFANTFLVKDLSNFSLNSNTTTSTTSSTTTTTGGGLLGGLLTRVLAIGTGGSTSGGGGGGLLGGLLTCSSQPSKSSLRTLMAVTVDWRSYLPPVKKQGSCGSCYAFGPLAQLETALAIKGQRVSLSEQEIVDCTSSYGNKGCSGGWMTKVYNYISDAGGVSSESSYPYKGVVQQCKPVGTKYGIVVNKVTLFDQSGIENALTNVGPVAVALQANVRSFQMYKSGVYYDDTCGAGPIDHIVALVGMGEESGKQYYIVRNSWGTGWGEGGYMRMVRTTRRVNDQGYYLTIQ